jgi:hypothetical protein
VSGPVGGVGGVVCRGEERHKVYGNKATKGCVCGGVCVKQFHIFNNRKCMMSLLFFGFLWIEGLRRGTGVCVCVYVCVCACQ